MKLFLYKPFKTLLGEHFELDTWYDLEKNGNSYILSISQECDYTFYECDFKEYFMTIEDYRDWCINKILL